MMWIAGGLASVIFLFTVENIWIDPWLRHRSHRIPSLVPDAQSVAWFLALAIGAIALTLLIVCWILLIRDRYTLLSMKLLVGVAVILALFLSVAWLRETNGQPGLLQSLASTKPHKVVLTWRPSSSSVTGYNIYRTATTGKNYVKINTVLVQGLTYTDDTVKSGVTYYYVTRAVDAQGHESVDSNEFSASIP
jgi:hypothetical protein